MNIKITKNNIHKVLQELSKHSFKDCDDFLYENVVFEYRNTSCWEENNEDEISIQDVWAGLRYEVEYSCGY